MIDAELWLNEAHRGVCIGWAQVRWQLNAEGCDVLSKNEMWDLVNLGLAMLALRTLPATVGNETSDSLKLLYQLLI